MNYFFYVHGLKFYLYGLNKHYNPTWYSSNKESIFHIPNLDIHNIEAYVVKPEDSDGINKIEFERKLHLPEIDVWLKNNIKPKKQ